MSEKKKIDIRGDNGKTNSEDSGRGPEANPSANLSEQDQDHPSGADQPGDPVKKLEAKLDAVTQEAKDNYDRLLRVSAEFENFKKRSAREMEESRKYANQALVKDLLPIIDNLELALKTSDESNQNVESNLREGVELTRKEILKVFEKYHVKQIEALGEPFDPNFHEAVMREESDRYATNTVTNELQKGYLMHDRLIRPAMVVVATPKNSGGNGE
jgi:molecular chaperone GrpE